MSSIIVDGTANATPQKARYSTRYFSATATPRELERSPLHDERAWRAWREKHESEYNTLLGEVDRAIERKKRMRNRWGGWQPVGERKLKRERYERLRAELGDRFIAGTIDREAAVRQWDKRRRDRRKIDPAQAAGE